MTLPTSVRPLDLKRAIAALGTPNLVGLVGDRRVEAYDEILRRGVNEKELAELLELRLGTQLLADRGLRSLLLARLPDWAAGYILDGKYSPNREIDQEARSSLCSMQWGRTRHAARRMLEVFGLSAEYLPPAPLEIPPRIEAIPGQTLFPHQARVKDQLLSLLTAEARRTLVHMPTGAGKTRTCVEALCDFIKVNPPSCTIVWLAHSEELCEQAVTTIRRCWERLGDRPLEVHRLWGSHPASELSSGPTWVVASLQRIHSMRLSRRDSEFRAATALKRRCAAVVVDEAHKSIAPTYKKAIEFVADTGQAKLIGLTATPGRGADSEENERLAAFFEKNRISLTDSDGSSLEDPIRFLQDQDYLARMRRREVKTNIYLHLTPQEQEHVATFFDLPHSALVRLADDASRNALIVAQIARLKEEGARVLVFSLSVDHAHLLAELLTLRGVAARAVDGSTPQTERHQAIDDFRSGELRVLVNYGVLTTGFDAPGTNAIVITRPTASLVLYSQMLGRGIRGPRVGGVDECTVVDLKDNIDGLPDERQAFRFFDDHWQAT